MKNFFKKLSFVLAIAMVLTSIAPATASAAEISATYVPAKKVNLKVNSEKVETFEMNVGDTQTVKVGLPVTKAAKEAGFTKSTFKTAHSVEGTAVEVVRVGNRTYEVTAVEAGEATITIGAAKNNKKAQAGEFKKTATLTVTVAASAEVTAKQTGANKITVTGADLTDAVADYVVKRGVNTLVINSVAVNEDKTEAVLTASSKNLAAGNYTVAFKEGEAVEFTCEAAKVAYINFLNDTAVLQTASTAAVKYAVYNQFDEKMTLNVGDFQISTSQDGVAGTNTATFGEITFGKNGNFTVTVDVVVATVVYKATGVNASATFTISNAAQPASAEVLGLYGLNQYGVYVPTTVDESGVNNAVAPKWLAVAVKDQYGNNVGTTYGDKTIADGLNLVAIDPYGLFKTTGTAIDLTDATGAKFAVGYPINETAALKAGNVAVKAVVLTNGSTADGSVEIKPVQKVASITLTPADTLYVGRATELDYIALDADGNEVTKFDLINAVNFTTKTNCTITVTKNVDGSAKISMVPTAQNVVLVTKTPTDVYSTTTFTANAKAYPVAVAGVASDAILGAISGESISVELKHIKVEDQYGLVMTSAEVIEAVSGGAYRFVVTIPNTVTTVTNAGCVAVPTANTDKVINLDTTGKASTGINVSLEKKNEAGNYVAVSGSDATINIKSVLVTDCTNFELKPVTLKQAGTTFGAIVYGYAGGTKVALTADDYEVTIGGSTNAGEVVVPATIAEDQITEYEGSYTVTISNKEGTALVGKYNYSEKANTISAAVLNPYDLAGATFRLPVDGSGLTLTVDEILDKFVVMDQYGNVITDGNAEYDAAIVSIQGYSVYSSLTDNGRTTVSYTEKVDTTITCTITFGNGYSVTQDFIIY